MDKIVLNCTNNSIEFKLNSVNSYILIKSVAFIVDEGVKWEQLIPMILLRIKLTCFIYKDTKKRFIDERINQFYIPIVPDINQKHPIFNIDKLIKNENLKIGINENTKHFSTLKIDLIETNKINEKYSIHLIANKHLIN